MLENRRSYFSREILCLPPRFPIPYLERKRERERLFLQNFNLYYFTRVQEMEIKFLGIHCTLRLEEILTCHAGRFDDGSCRQ